MIVMALSAQPRMTSWEGESVKFAFEMAGNCVSLMMDVTPALLQCKLWLSTCGGVTHNIPMLIATKTPNFSLLFIVKVQMTFHGMTASTMSITPEYTGNRLACHISTQI
jgi:hypothetical protein